MTKTKSSKIPNLLKSRKSKIIISIAVFVLVGGFFVYKSFATTYTTYKSWPAAGLYPKDGTKCVAKFVEEGAAKNGLFVQFMSCPTGTTVTTGAEVSLLSIYPEPINSDKAGWYRACVDMKGVGALTTHFYSGINSKNDATIDLVPAADAYTHKCTSLIYLGANTLIATWMSMGKGGSAINVSSFSIEYSATSPTTNPNSPPIK